MQYKAASIGLFFCFDGVLDWVEATFIKPEIPRSPNVHRDRECALEYIRSWDDDMFQRQFRLERADFYPLLQLISPLIEVNEKMAARSSGSSVNPELRLAMTMRMLAGAQYLDLIWYRVNINHVWHYIDPVLAAIHRMVDNVKLPYTVEALDELTAEWSSISQRRFDGMDLMPDQCGATDGLVVEVTKRTEEDLQGLDSAVYCNRKGFFGMVAQAICGAYCQFLMFAIDWPGATNDCTAFQQCEGMRWLAWLTLIGRGWLAGDDAYSAIHPRLLTPFTKKQLRKAKENNTTTYFMMRAFNHVLCSRRITIERAFGILIRRFGCLWSALERRDQKCALMVIVCVKLHNICVNRWRVKHPMSRVPQVPSHINVPADIEARDDEVVERLENLYIGVPKKAGQNSIRLTFLKRIYDCGIRFTKEDDFLSPFNDN
jgi:hypothetical protein